MTNLFCLSQAHFLFFPGWLAEGRSTFGHLSDPEVSMSELISFPSNKIHSEHVAYVRETLRQWGLNCQSTTYINIEDK